MLAKLKTRSKIVTAFAMVQAIVLALGAVSWLTTGTFAGIVDNFARHKVPALEALATMYQATTGVRANCLTIANAGLRREVRNVSLERFDAALKRYEEGATAYAALQHSDQDAKLWRDFEPLATRWKSEIRAFIRLAQEKKGLEEAGADAARLGDLDRRLVPALETLVSSGPEVNDALKKLFAQTRADAAALATSAVVTERTGKVTLSVAVALTALLLIGLGVVLSRSIGGVIRGLLSEAGKLSGAVGAGKLDVRGDVRAVNAEFRPVIEGMNRTMDAFVKPIQMTASCVERISRGDIPEKIADRYEGDFDAIKQDLNRCIDAVRLLVEDANALSHSAVDGKLSARADASRHHGDFQKVVQGVNETLDAVLAPMEESQRVLERLAQRDLTVRVQGHYEGEHARIKEAVNGAAEALHHVLTQVADAVAQVSGAAGQIASSSQSVASGASEQASSLEQTHSSLETVAARTRQAAGNAQQASALASDAKTAAEEGASAMSQMSGAMAKIRQSAEGTSAIIKDISEIAFQTNLLALNAAVEAARAGESGRGFAVVAEEVRSLALRAKEAAVKTEELIKQSVKQTGEGESAAQQVNDKLAVILAAAMKVNDIVSDITASSREQADGIEQVNKAVGEMDVVTQQNAGSSEETSSAAEELSNECEKLAAMVGSFQLGQGAREPTRPDATLTAARPPRTKSASAATGLAVRSSGPAA